MSACLLYTSDAADDLLCVDLGGRRIIKKKKKTQHNWDVKTTLYYDSDDTLEQILEVPVESITI